MTSTLIFPDGVRLLSREDLPGSPEQVESEWQRIQAANITAGFVLEETHDSRYPYFAEINVDAPKIWGLFRALAEQMLSPEAELIIGPGEEDPRPVGHGPTRKICDALEPHRYQLANDGFIEFGLIRQTEDSFTEVFVGCCKYFKVWFANLDLFRVVMAEYGLEECESLEFIDEYPRATRRLPDYDLLATGPDELVRYFSERLAEI